MAPSGPSAPLLGIIGALAGAASGGLTAWWLPRITDVEATTWWLVPSVTFALLVGGTMSVASRSFRRVAFAWVPLALAAWPVACWFALFLTRAGSAVLVGAGGGLLGGAFVGWGNGLVAAARGRAFWATTLTGGAAGALCSRARRGAFPRSSWGGRRSWARSRACARRGGVREGRGSAGGRRAGRRRLRQQGCPVRSAVGRYADTVALDADAVRRASPAQAALFEALAGCGTIIVATGPPGVSANLVGAVHLRRHGGDDLLDVDDGTHHVHLDWSRLRKAEVSTHRGEGLLTLGDGGEPLLRLYRMRGPYPASLEALCRGDLHKKA